MAARPTPGNGAFQNASDPLQPRGSVVRGSLGRSSQDRASRLGTTGALGSGSGEGTLPPDLVASGSDKEALLHPMVGSGSVDAPANLAAVSPDSSPNPGMGAARNTGTSEKKEPDNVRSNILDRVAARRACQEQVAAAVEDDPDLAAFLGLADTPDTDPAAHLQPVQRLDVGAASQCGASAVGLSHGAPRGERMSPLAMAAHQLKDAMRGGAAASPGSKALGVGAAPGTGGFEEGINGQRIAQEVLLKTEYGRWNEQGKKPSRRLLERVEMSAQGSNTLSLEEAWGTTGLGMPAGGRVPLHRRSPVPGIPFIRPAGGLSLPQKDEDSRGVEGHRPALMGSASPGGAQFPLPSGPRSASKGRPEPLFLRCTSPSPPEEVKEKIARESLMAAPAPMNTDDNRHSMADQDAAPLERAVAEPPNSALLMVCPFPLFAPHGREVVEHQRPKPASPLFPSLPSRRIGSEPYSSKGQRTLETGGEKAAPLLQSPARMGMQGGDSRGQVRLGISGPRIPWRLQLHSGNGEEEAEMPLAQQDRSKGAEDADMTAADMASADVAMHDVAKMQPGEGSTKASAKSSPKQGLEKGNVDNEGKALDRSGSSQMPGIGAAVILSPDGNQAAAGGTRALEASEDRDCKSTSEGATSSSTSQVKGFMLRTGTISGGRPVVVHFGQDGAGSSLIGRRTSAGSGVGTPAIATALQQAQGSGSSAVGLRQVAPGPELQLQAAADRPGQSRQGTMAGGDNMDHAIVPSLNAEQKPQVIFTKAEDVPLPASAAAVGIAATATALGSSARRSNAVQQLPSSFPLVPCFSGLRGPPAPSQGSTDVLSLPRPTGSAGRAVVGPCMFQPYTKRQGQLKGDDSTPAPAVGGTSVSVQVWLSRWLRPSAQLTQPAAPGRASSPAKQDDGAHNRSAAAPLAPDARPRSNPSGLVLSKTPEDMAVHAATVPSKDSGSVQVCGPSPVQCERACPSRPAGLMPVDAGKEAAAVPAMRSPAHPAQGRALQQPAPVSLEMSENEIRQLSLQDEAGAALGGRPEGPAVSGSVQDDSYEHLMGFQRVTAADAEGESASMDAEAASEEEEERAHQEEQECMHEAAGEGGAAGRHDEGEGSSAGVVPLADNWWQRSSRAPSPRLHARAHRNVGPFEPLSSPARGPMANAESCHFHASGALIEPQSLNPTSASAFASMGSFAGPDPAEDNPFRTMAGNPGGGLGLGGFAVGALEGAPQARRRSSSAQGTTRGHQAGRSKSMAAAGRAAVPFNLAGAGGLQGAEVAQAAPTFDAKNTEQNAGSGPGDGLLFNFHSPLEQFPFANPAGPAPCPPDLFGAAEMQLQRSIAVLEREREALRAAELINGTGNNTLASTIDPVMPSWETTLRERMYTGLGAGYMQMGPGENPPFLTNSHVPFFAGLPDYTDKAPLGARQQEQPVQGEPPQDPINFNAWNPAWPSAVSTETPSLDEFRQLEEMAPADSLGNMTAHPRSPLRPFAPGHSGSDFAGGFDPAPPQGRPDGPFVMGTMGLQATRHGGRFEAPSLFSAGHGPGRGMLAAQKAGAGRARGGYHSKGGSSRHRNSREPPKFINSRCNVPDDDGSGTAAPGGPS